METGTADGGMTARDGSVDPAVEPLTSTEPTEPVPAPATPTTQGASIPVESASRTDGGNGVDLGLVVVIWSSRSA